MDGLESRTLLTSVTSILFNIDSPTHDIAVKFDGPINPASLGASDLIVRKVGSDARVAATGFSVATNADSTSAVFSSSALFANGDYTIQVLKEDIEDANGAELAVDASSQFFFLQGDSTGPNGVRDRIANLQDRSIVRNHLGLSPATYSEGDYDYDGTVTASDYVFITNTALPLPVVGVSGVTATLNEGGNVEIAWTHASAISTGFRVQRSGETAARSTRSRPIFPRTRSATPTPPSR